MQTFSFNNYQPSLSSIPKAREIFETLKSMVQNNEPIEIDMNGMAGMSTVCARTIFGKLYSHLGEDRFYEVVRFRNLSDTMEIIIQWGIEQELKKTTSKPTQLYGMTNEIDDPSYCFRCDSSTSTIRDKFEIESDSDTEEM